MQSRVFARNFTEDQLERLRARDNVEFVSAAEFDAVRMESQDSEVTCEEVGTDKFGLPICAGKCKNVLSQCKLWITSDGDGGYNCICGCKRPKT